MNRLESNHLAVDIFEQGGVWKTNNDTCKVQIYGMSVLQNGIIVLKVFALEGKPFVEKIDYGDGRTFTRKSEYTTRFPRNLTPIKETE